MFKKIYQILNEEGIRGIYQRIRIRIYYLIKPKIVKSAYGVYLMSNWGDATFNLCFNGTYGYFFSNFLKKIKSNYEFIDIGANQGIYSLIASQNSNFKKVIAFEPITSTYKLFKDNIKINKSKKIFVKKLAISDTSGISKIYFNKKHSGAASIYKGNTKNSQKILKIKTIDYKILNKILNSKTKKIVKIDVEGHELVVLNQLIKLNFFKLIDYIFIEVNFNFNKTNYIKKKLAKYNFKDVYKTKTINNHCDFLFKRKT